MKLSLLLLLFGGLSHVLFVQQEAWVHFSDKANVETALQNPITILSQRALDRKNAHDIAVDARDVPVNEAYISLLKAANGIEVLSKSKWMNAVHVHGKASAIAALKAYDFVPRIDYADKNMPLPERTIVHQRKFEKENIPDDYNHGQAQNQIEMLNVNVLHQNGFTGEGIILAVIDAGFPNVNTLLAFQHLRDHQGLFGGYDFVNRSSRIYDASGNSHGIGELSTMAGYIEDEYVGTAPGAAYYLFRTETEDMENPVEESLWVEAAERADSLEVHIINSSLGYNTFDDPRYDYSPSEMDGETAFIIKGANIASQKGMLVVNSPGNTGNDSWGVVIAPADAPQLLTVGAVDRTGRYATLSSQGRAVQATQKPDVVAHGSGSKVIDENDAVVNGNATSFSAPILAGGMACLWQALPNATAEVLKQYVQRSANQYAEPDYNLGCGISNFEHALAQALSIESFPKQKIKIFPNPVLQELTIQEKSELEGYAVTIYDMVGQELRKYRGVDVALTLEVSTLSSRMYVLSVSSKNLFFNF